MGTHPNVILLAELKPDGLPRKTMEEILAGCDITADEEVRIAGEEYCALVMEENYDKDWQIAAAEGSLVFFRLVTYGYGVSVHWDQLEAEKIELEKWAAGICERHSCQRQIRVTANYW